MRKTLCVSLIILALGVILSGGFLIIPSTATLNPVFDRQPVVDAPVFKAKSTDNYSVSNLQDFIAFVQNGDRNSVVGVYIPGVIAYPVDQQPAGNAGFVTRNPNEVTQFGLARNYGTVGILAHNDLAGADFTNISMNQYVTVVYGDGHVDYYVTDDIQKYQALTPTSTFSDFINLDNTKEHLTAGDLFNRVYGTGNRLVFQTCIAAYGDPSWGRIFIIARPATSQVKSVFDQTVRLLQFASFGLAGY